VDFDGFRLEVHSKQPLRLKRKVDFGDFGASYIALGEYVEKYRERGREKDPPARRGGVH
jgi:hypothetical protein